MGSYERGWVVLDLAQHLIIGRDDVPVFDLTVEHVAADYGLPRGVENLLLVLGCLGPAELLVVCRPLVVEFASVLLGGDTGAADAPDVAGLGPAAAGPLLHAPADDNEAHEGNDDHPQYDLGILTHLSEHVLVPLIV